MSYCPPLRGHAERAGRRMPPHFRSRHRFALCLALLAALPLTGACAPPDDAAAPAAPAAPAADKQTIRALLSPRLESTLSSQIAGRIAEITVDNGDRFQKGQRLVQFDCAVQRAQLERANAELLGARKKHESNLQLQSYKSIGDLEVAISAAEVEKARAEVSLAGAQSAMCRVDAPFDGRVIKRIARPHESVNQGQPLIEILDDSRLKIELFVPSRWLTWLQPGTRFAVHIDETGKRYPASVKSIGAKVDAVSQSIEIVAEIEGEQPDLLAGMSGEAHFEVPQRP